MAEMRLANGIDEARARDPNEQVDQINLEMDNLRNEILLANEENNSLKAAMKYREIFLLVLLISCGVAGKYFGSVSEAERQTAMQMQAQKIELLLHNIDEIKRQTRKGNVESEIGDGEKQAREMHDWRSRKTEQVNELGDQIKQELADLKVENRLAKEENNSMRAEIGKCRFLFFVLLLIICGAVVAYLALLRDIDYQANKLGYVNKRVREIRINTEMQNWGEFVWPIDGWAAKAQSARDGSCERIFSNPFYSHKNGYKMCLSVCPDRYRTVRTTYLFVNFHLMRGAFDNILSWPFKRDVTVSLINQHTGIDLVSYTFIFDKYPNHVNWNKPLRERNVGNGTRLIGLTELSRNAGLCRDDKIFIRCIVK